MDNLTYEKRHENMVAIKSSETRPEKEIRSALHKIGFRFRKNDSRLPGKPDIVLPHYKAVIFVNGCFWHGHTGCKYFVMPKTNTEFWQNKINRMIDFSSLSDHVQPTTRIQSATMSAV